MFVHQNICKSCWRECFEPFCVRYGTYECIATGMYQGAQKKLLRASKFNADPFSTYVLERQLRDTYLRTKTLGYDYITCVPGITSRLRARKIDLPYHLAKKLSRWVGVPFHPDLIQRVSKVKPQLGLSKAARKQNVQKSFTAKRRLLGKKIAVIDDVYTTGATCEAVINSLYEVDAQHVTLFVLARTPEPTTKP